MDTLEQKSTAPDTTFYDLVQSVKVENFRRQGSVTISATLCTHSVGFSCLHIHDEDNADEPEDELNRANQFRFNG